MSRNYFAQGDKEKTAKEYELFCGCFAQLLDPMSMVGDVENRWVIFQHGWVADLSSYETEPEARKVADQIFRTDRDASYIIVRVDADEHKIDGLRMLASAMGEADDFDLSTTPDEASRVQEGSDPATL